MLENTQKTTLLYKAYNGYGDSRSEKELFEEPYKSFGRVFKSAVLTLGSLIPRSADASPITVDDIKALDETNNTIYWKQSSFKTWELIKFRSVELTCISPNADDAYVALDENGVQYKNVIPFDFYEDLYNYKLLKQNGEEILYGVCDWSFDVNSSILTFYNGVPEGVDALHPPILQFYQYVGPTGDMTYLDGLYADFNATVSGPIKNVTEEIKEVIFNTLGEDWYNKNFCNGSDLTQGIAINLQKITPVVYAETKDPLNGYDRDSDKQVVSQISNVKGVLEDRPDIEILYATQNLAGKTIESIQIPEGTNIVYAEEGFFVARNTAAASSANITFEESSELFNITLLKDGSAYKLFEPRESFDLTFKVPLIVDLLELPPTMKLSSFNSFSDNITPQYYGPRVADWVIADFETSADSKSVDAICYDTAESNLADCIAQAHEKVSHVLVRGGTYTCGRVVLDKPLVIRAERPGTIIKDGRIFINKDVTFVGFDFQNVEIRLGYNKVNATFVDCHIDNGLNFAEFSPPAAHDAEISLLNTVVLGELASNGANITIANRSYVENLNLDGSKFFISGSSIGTLDVTNTPDGCIIDTTKIDRVENKPKNVKLASSYVVEYSENISKDEIPSENSIVYYKSFEERVYSNLPKTFHYNEETNAFEILVDTENLTIQINERGELYCRPLDGSEILFSSSTLTQYEEHYHDKPDTPLDGDPKTVAEALTDLYYKKADLKHGKVPLQQLPDSVAYGGLHYVGKWSFEDNEGKYPTFDDIVNKYSLDTEVDELQLGWFFICDSSHKEDDPAAPQIAIDEEVYTAGDWLIYGGKRDDDSLIWDKLDRAYQEAAFARLPALAPYEGQDLEWIRDKGGEGLLDFALVTISEAFKLINKELVALQAGFPNTINEIELQVKEDKNKYFKYCKLLDSTASNTGYTISEPYEAIQLNGEEPALPITIETKHDDPEKSELDQCFYVGTARVFSDNPLVEEQIDIFNPYEKWLLGIQPRAGDPLAAHAKIICAVPEENTIYDNISLRVNVTEGDSQLKVGKPLAYYCGETKPFDFSAEYRKLYKLENFDVAKIETYNKADFRSCVQKFYGQEFMTSSVPLSATISFKNVFKDVICLNDIDCYYARAEITDANGETKTSLVKAISRTLKKGEDGYCDVDATFVFDDILKDFDAIESTIKVYAFVQNVFGYSSSEFQCFEMFVRLMRDASFGPLFGNGQVKSGTQAFPRIDVASSDGFGAHMPQSYVESFARGFELMFDNYSKSYKYTIRPVHKLLFDNYFGGEGDAVEALPQDPLDGITIGSNVMRCLSIRKDLDEEMDLTGFKVNIEWDGDEPTLNPRTGALNDVALITGVSVVTFDANSIVPAYHVPQFTQGEACCHPGKSSISSRVVTFGRSTLAANKIFVRLAIPNNGLAIKNISISDIH